MKYKTPIIILSVLAVAALVFYFIKRNAGFGSLQLRNSDWEAKKFTVRSPFGTTTIQGQPLTSGDQIVHSNSDFQLVARKYQDNIEIALVHLNPADPIMLEQLDIDYNKKSVFPTSLTVAEYQKLTA